MSKGKEIFHAVCDAPDLEAAVKELPMKQWARLYAYLLQTYDENGVSGQILGLMLFEGARRYAGAAAFGAKFETMEKTREVMG